MYAELAVVVATCVAVLGAVGTRDPDIRFAEDGGGLRRSS